MNILFINNVPERDGYFAYYDELLKERSDIILDIFGNISQSVKSIGKVHRDISSLGNLIDHKRKSYDIAFIPAEELNDEFNSLQYKKIYEELYHNDINFSYFILYSFIPQRQLYNYFINQFNDYNIDLPHYFTNLPDFKEFRLIDKLPSNLNKFTLISLYVILSRSKDLNDFLQIYNRSKLIKPVFQNSDFDDWAIQNPRISFINSEKIKLIKTGLNFVKNLDKPDELFYNKSLQAFNKVLEELIDILD
jgi:hypothetical protein